MEDDLAGILEKEVGVMEDPAGSNDGVRVREYLRATDIDYPQPWCASFVSWGCKKIGLEAFGAWTPSWCVPRLEIDDPCRNSWGLVFYPKLGRFGHIFVVTEVKNELIRTVEGNTNDDGSREGVGVVRRWRDAQAYRYFIHK
jgi:hypothetical protein